MNVEEKLWHRSMCEGRASALHQHQEEFVELPLEDCVAMQPVLHLRRRTKMGGKACSDAQVFA